METNVSVINNVDTMTSLQVAEATNRRHKDVLETIRKMEPSWVKEGGRKFSLTSYKDTQGKDRPMFILDKNQCLFVSTKFKDDARARLVLRWEQLEKERQVNMTPTFQVPQTFSQALILAAQQAEQIEQQQLMLTQQHEQINALEDKVSEMASKVSYLDNILANKSTVVVTQIAQDYGMSAKHFNSLLNSLGIQYKVNDQWILYGKYLAEGYVHSKQVVIDLPSGTTKIKFLTEWTQKGRVFLYNILKENDYLPLIEQ